jgi:hypothetical protein
LSKHVTKQIGLQGPTLSDTQHTVLTGESFQDHPKEKLYLEFYSWATLHNQTR